MRKISTGFTMVELVLVIAVSLGLASAFASLFAPQIGMFLSLPERHIVQSAASDVLDTIVEGDAGAKGLRHAGRGGAVLALTEAAASNLTYAYEGQDSVNHMVALRYTPATKRFARSVDGGAFVSVPSYGQGADGQTRLVVDVINARFFRYYDAAGTEITPLPLSAANRARVRRIDVAIRLGLGAGGTAVQGRPMIALKTGVDIKNTT